MTNNRQPILGQDTGLIYSEMDDLPSLEYFEKMNARKLKYNSYEEYLGDLVEKIVNRPVR